MPNIKLTQDESAIIDEALSLLEKKAEKLIVDAENMNMDETVKTASKERNKITDLRAKVTGQEKLV